jgi:hypothetical protein
MVPECQLFRRGWHSGCHPNWPPFWHLQRLSAKVPGCHGPRGETTSHGSLLAGPLEQRVHVCPELTPGIAFYLRQLRLPPPTPRARPRVRRQAGPLQGHVEVVPQNHEPRHLRSKLPKTQKDWGAAVLLPSPQGEAPIAVGVQGRSRLTPAGVRGNVNRSKEKYWYSRSPSREDAGILPRPQGGWEDKPGKLGRWPRSLRASDASSR